MARGKEALPRVEMEKAGTRLLMLLVGYPLHYVPVLLCARITV